MRSLALAVLLSLALVLPALAAPVVTALDPTTFVVAEESANGTLVQLYKVEGGRPVLQSALTTTVVRDRGNDRVKVVTQEMEIDRRR